MEYEYKVEQIYPLQKRGYIDGNTLEAIINKYAAKGWEYCNTISFPEAASLGGVTDYYAPINLVFRRAR